MTPAEHGDVVQLCADASAGYERQMLVYALWRIKTDEARSLIRDLLRDPSVAKHAIYSARRAFGNEEARALIEPLVDDPEVGGDAAHALKRIDRARR
jgi:HEAT repeat protein